jgi:hypothetical protein
MELAKSTNPEYEDTLGLEMELTQSTEPECEDTMGPRELLLPILL